MYVLLAASPQGLAASLVYGRTTARPAGTGVDDGRRPDLGGGAGPPAEVIDITPERAETGTRRRGEPPARTEAAGRLQGPQTPLRYAQARRRGEPPRLLTTESWTGQTIDVYA
jgi:hypothetical protein